MPNLEPPQGSPGDTAHLMARAVISAIPGMGGAALEMFNAIVVPPLEKRRAEWTEQLTQAFVVLQSRVTDLENLKNNPAFIDAIIQASRIAITNNQQEKIEALKNAVINSGLSNSIDRSLQQVFLSYVDSFTVFHLKILDLFSRQDKLNALMQRGVDPDAEAFIYAEMPELTYQNDLTKLVWAELNSKGLLKGGQLGIVARGNGYLIIKHSTNFGDQFLSFIKKTN